MGIKTLFLAAGHGGHDRGHTSIGIIERDEVSTFVAGMRRWYELNNKPIGKLGGVVILPDQLDLAGELRELARWKLSAADGDLAVDVHLDWRNGGSGALVICNRFPLAQRVAHEWLSRWCAATGIKNNGVHDSKTWARTQRGWDDMGFCRPKHPAIIVELGCLVESDMQRVRDRVNQALAAQLLWEIWSAV